MVTDTVTYPLRRRWSGVRRLVSSLVGSHLHDPAEQVDEALEAYADGRRALQTR